MTNFISIPVTQVGVGDILFLKPLSDEEFARQEADPYVRCVRCTTKYCPHACRLSERAYKHPVVVVGIELRSFNGPVVTFISFCAIISNPPKDMEEQFSPLAEWRKGLTIEVERSKYWFEGDNFAMQKRSFINVRHPFRLPYESFSNFNVHDALVRTPHHPLRLDYKSYRRLLKKVTVDVDHDRHRYEPSAELILRAPNLPILSTLPMAAVLSMVTFASSLEMMMVPPSIAVAEPQHHLGDSSLGFNSNQIQLGTNIQSLLEPQSAGVQSGEMELNAEALWRYFFVPSFLASTQRPRDTFLPDQAQTGFLRPRWLIPIAPLLDLCLEVRNFIWLCLWFLFSVGIIRFMGRAVLHRML